MQTQSFDFSENQMTPVSVEVMLLPGLPALHLLGDVSRELKECAPKLKSAFLKQGFQWPRTRQMIVDVRSANGKPAGREIELAIAVGLLQALGELPPCLPPQAYVGELTLEGLVRSPLWLNTIKPQTDLPIVSAAQSQAPWGVRELKDIVSPLPNAPLPRVNAWTPPSTMSTLFFSASLARFLAVVAAGEHHALIAGPPGTGKTTAVSALHQLLDPLSLDDQLELCNTHLNLGFEPPTFRPFAQPHHTTRPQALLGGGVPPRPGEITRAHGGLLFLDEYLQFSMPVQEALREPLERHEIRLARGSYASLFPSDFLLVAATNLCPCGHLQPEMARACPSTLTRCRSHVDRLSGPMVDRFALVEFSHRWRGSRSVSFQDISLQVQGAIKKRRTRGQARPNGKTPHSQLKANLSPGARVIWPEELGSDRRQASLCQVAQTLADLDGFDQVESAQISEALRWVIHPHHQLTQLFA